MEFILKAKFSVLLEVHLAVIPREVSPRLVDERGGEQSGR